MWPLTYNKSLYLKFCTSILWSERITSVDFQGNTKWHFPHQKRWLSLLSDTLNRSLRGISYFVPLKLYHGHGRHGFGTKEQVSALISVVACSIQTSHHLSIDIKHHIKGCWLWITIIPVHLCDYIICYAHFCNTVSTGACTLCEFYSL